MVTSHSAAVAIANRRSPKIDLAIEPDQERAPSSSDALLEDRPLRSLTILIAVPTLQAGAADSGAVELVRTLAAAGHKAIIVSEGGRLSDQVTTAGGVCIVLRMASCNPIIVLRNALKLKRIIREHRCDLLHAHSRAPAWSTYLAARLTGVPFVTTWYKGFREQNPLKRLYNSVMVRGGRVIAVSEQLAELIHDRYETPWSRISVVPLSIDVQRFDPATVSRERITAVRRAWGVAATDRVILVVGRMLRRKGHHVVVEAARRLKAMGVKNFVFVFAAEDHGTRYAAELWDQVMAAGASDVIRMAGAD